MTTHTIYQLGQLYRAITDAIRPHGANDAEYQNALHRPLTEITTAINSFSEEYRIPFSMHVAGYKYHEIAEKMDLPLGTVKSRIFFARQRLQEMLKDYK